MPIAPPTSPLIDLVYNDANSNVSDTISRDELFELQREQEARLLGTFFVQSIFLALAIMLYASWEWSQFGQPVEAAIFYGLMGFSLQAAMYFSFRTLFEDSSNHRRELKRMKNKQKRKMANISFEIRKMQTENILQQQMAQYKTQMQMANADGVITPQEQAILNQSISAINQTAQAGGMGNMTLDDLAKELGIDRHKIGPIPIGPKLTFDQAPISTMNVTSNQKEDPKLDLNPSNDKSLEAQIERKLA